LIFAADLDNLYAPQTTLLQPRQLAESRNRAFPLDAAATGIARPEGYRLTQLGQSAGQPSAGRQKMTS